MKKLIFVMSIISLCAIGIQAVISIIINIWGDLTLSQINNTMRYSIAFGSLVSLIYVFLPDKSNKWGVGKSGRLNRIASKKGRFHKSWDDLDGHH